MNILNGTPEGVPLDVSRATLPINQLKSTVIFDDRSNSNVHRCIRINIKKPFTMGSTQSSSVNLHRHVEERDTVKAKAETEDRKVDITPFRIENAHGNITLPLESPSEGADLHS